MKYKMCMFIVIFASIYVTSSLQKQYLIAYKFARSTEGFRYTHGQAHIWAKKFVEDKAIFRAKGLVSQYNEALDFAIEFLEIATKEADEWSKKIVLSRGSIRGFSKVSTELDIFFNRTIFNSEDGKKWAESFLTSSEPLVSKINIEENYLDIYTFCRTHIFLSYDHSKAHDIAQNFIQNRFRFSDNFNLLEQYVIAFEFARSSRGLRLQFEKAREWAQNYLELRGTFDPQFNLEEQYREAFLFARQSGGLRLTDRESVLWAKKFIKRHALFSLDQNLLDKYREAFLFAYNGEVLDILSQIREAPAGVFLRDEAQKYAQKLLQSRGAEVNPTTDLLLQYENAFIFAYSSDGLQLDYYKAKNWAKKFLEHRIIR